MTVKSKTIAGLFAAAVFLASAAAAMAAPAVATGNANVRAGAGTGYPVISSVHYGQQVNVDGCNGNWCHVQKSGRDGWVSANYLSFGGGNHGHHGNNNHGHHGNNWGHGHHQTVGVNACVGGHNASFCLGF